MANQDGQVIYRVVIDDSNVDSEMRNAENKVEKGSSGLAKKAATGAMAIGAGIAGVAAGIGIAAVKSADDMDKAMNQFIASTGKGLEETERYQGVLESIYTNNYGESFEDIAQKMGLVNQQMGDLSDEELKRVTEQAYLLQDTFEIDFSESLRGVNALTKQFGITSDEAFNLLAQGAQQGLNQNEDLADQLAEYSVYYKDLGFSAEEAFNIMKAGAEDGAFQLDYVNDAIKEFGIRSKDGSKASAEAFKALGLDATKMTKLFAKGGKDASKAWDMVSENLQNIDDEVKKNEIGVALFGTKFEDLGESAVSSMLEFGNSIDSTNDKLGEMETIKYGSTSEMLEGLKRSVEPLLIDLGQGLVPILKQIAEGLMPVVEKLLPVFSDILMGIIPHLATLIETLLPVFVELFETLIPPVMEIVEALFPALVSLIQALLPIIVMLIDLLEPVIELFVALAPIISDLVENAIVPLINILSVLIEKWFEILKMDLQILKEVFIAVFSSIKNFIVDQVKIITDVFDTWIDFIRNVFTGNWEAAWENVIDIFRSVFKGLKNAAKFPMNALIDSVNGALKGLNGIKIPDWVPKLGGKTFNIDLIPRLAQGGLAFGDTMAVVGDNQNSQIDPEVIAPLSKLKAMLGIDINKGGLSGQKVIYNNVTVRDNVIDSSNIDTIGTDLINKLKREGSY